MLHSAFLWVINVAKKALDCRQRRAPITDLERYSRWLLAQIRNVFVIIKLVLRFHSIISAIWRGFVLSEQ